MSTPALAIPDNVKAARLQVQTTDFFALCYLMLANLAYAAEDNAQAAVQQIMDRLPAMPAPQGQVTGQWTLGWGPVASNDNSNLMYAAEFSDQKSGLPIFSAVAIRGTDVQAKPAGVLKQIIEDLDAENQVVFPENNTAGAKIAQGSKAGLDVLTSFKDKSGRTVALYANNFVSANPRTPIVVTGHSLGGCQTTVLASYLSGQLPAGTAIVPNTFAAPTAGNSAFIQLYEKTFPYCPRWYSPYDLVPKAFAGLDDIKRLWDQCGRSAPDIVKILISALEFMLTILHVNYSQQSDGDSRMLGATCQPATVALLSPAAQNQVVAEIQALLQDAVSKLQAQIAKLPVVGGLAAHKLSFTISTASFQNIGDWVQELLFQHSVLTGYWNAVKAAPGVASIPNPFAQAAGN